MKGSRLVRRRASTPLSPLWAIAACLAVSGAPSLAHAEEPVAPVAPVAKAPGKRTSALSWLRLEGADACVSTQELARAVEERLARKVFVPPSEADLSIEAHVRFLQGRFRSVVTVRDAKGVQLGRRELDDTRCENLTDPLSLVIALMIDPDAASRKPLPTPDAESDKPAATTTEAPPPRETPPPLPPPPELHRDPPSDTTKLRGAVNLSSGFSLGRLPGAGPMLKLSGWLKPLHLPGVAAGFTYGFDNTEPVLGGAEGKVGLATGFASICPLGAGFWTPEKRGYILSCLGMELGALRAEGVGFARNSVATRFMIDVQLSIELSLRLVGPLAFHFAPTVFVPLIRDDINYRAADGTDRLLFRMSRVGASFEAGLGLRF